MNIQAPQGWRVDPMARLVGPNVASASRPKQARNDRRISLPDQASA